MRGRSIIAFTGRYHGLGNRMRVVLGARSLARFSSRDFAYTWPLGRQFGARLDELWEFGERRISPAASRLLSLRHPYRGAELEWMDDARDERVWQIRTAHALHLPQGATPWGEELRSLRPAAGLADRIRDFHQRHLAGSPYLGVSIRTHTIVNAKTLAHSPLEWYLERMHEVRRDSPDLPIFVSADTPAVQERVLAELPHTFALSGKGAYNSRESLLSCIVDLYLLAGATHLIGPHYSSFPELAQQLAGPSLLLETSQSDPDTRFAAPAALEVAPDPVSPHRRKSV